MAGNPAAAFTSVSGFGPGEPDSFRVLVAADDMLLFVEVLGIDSIDQARELALGFAADSLACAEDGASCGPYAIPAVLAVPPATPEAAASPVP